MKVAALNLENKIAIQGYPDAVSFLKKTAAEGKLNYQLFSDSSGDMANAFGISFKAPEGYKPYIMKSSEGKNSTFLPVPSVFIVNENSEIVFEYLSPDYKNRISKELLIAVSTVLKQ